MKLLVVDDELSMRELLEIIFRAEGYEVATAGSLLEARKLLQADPAEILVCDLRLGDGSGLELLTEFHQQRPDGIFILITAYASADSAIDALKMGAFDYITKPFDIEEMKKLVKSAADRLSQPSLPKDGTGSHILPETAIVGVSPAMIKIYKTIGVVASTDSTILITGESGTGKEMIARAIHEASPRKNFPFVPLNCGAFPETLLESEIFGYQKGAFTGAVSNKRGLFEAAGRGTLFLDEITETSLTVQVKLLRSIQEKKVRRLGSTEEIPIDVRIIAASNRDLQEQIKSGLFREDLYYRLAVIPIHLPPLRERREDIPALARYFLQKFNMRMGKALSGFEPDAMSLILKHDWRGNVRELENTIERAVTMETTDKIKVDRLPLLVADSAPRTVFESVEPVIPGHGLALEEFLEDLERKLIVQALSRTNGVQIEAARLLKLTYRSLRHRMQKLHISS